jgi:hypothetical protein
MRYRLAIVALLMIASSAAEADPHSIMGIGGNTCAVFAKDYQSNPQIETIYTSWAAGFMSGANMMVDAAGGSSTDISAMSLSDKQPFLRSICQENPLSQYLEGVFALMKKMPKFKLKAQ